jgi:hypothetical protein
VLRFSEPMEARSLTLGSAGPRRDPLRLAADGVPVPYRCFLDRTRHELTVMPTEPLPPGADVALELTTRVRDASGNPLDPASPRIVTFTTAAAGPSGAGRIVEAFEDREGLDPLGTTVRWNDPAEPGVLSGVLEPVALESGVPSDTAVVLDPRGGSFRILVPAAELGDEPRVLRALHLLAAPGPLPGEVLEPAVRLAAVPRGLTAVPSEAPAAWVPVTEGLRGAAPRGADGAILLPFRHPFVHDGSSALLVEFTWAGVAGNVILLAARAPEPRTLAWGSDPGPVSLRLSPTLRAEAMGERATARSRWLDAGVPLPSWQEPRARPHPDPARTCVEFQGAPPAADGRGPDEARATRWSADPLVLEGSRWVRFRVHFEPAPQGEPAPHLDDLTIPFVGR